MTNAVDPLETALARIDGWDVPVKAAAVTLNSRQPEGPETATYGQVDTLAPLASVTKPLFAYAAMIAVEEGTLDLDEPAGPFGSTVRHLLAHGSGLPFEVDPDHEPATPSATAPGTRRVYSNVGFEVLGTLLESRAGISATDYTVQAVCEPLGMTATTIVGSVAKAGVSTVRDLSRLAGEFLRPTLVARSTFEAFTTCQFPDLAGVVPGFGTQRPCPWGLGVEIRGWKRPHWTATQNSPETFGHFGASGSFLWVDPLADVALVCLTGRAFGPWAPPLWNELSDAVLAVAARR